MKAAPLSVFDSIYHFYGRVIEECGKNIMVDAAGISLNAGELYWIDDSRNYVL